MTQDVEHVFICLFAVSSLIRCLFRSFAIFKSSYLLLIVFWEFFIYFGYLSFICFAEIFSQSLVCSLHVIFVKSLTRFLLICFYSDFRELQVGLIKDFNTFPHLLSTIFSISVYPGQHSFIQAQGKRYVLPMEVSLFPGFFISGISVGFGGPSSLPSLFLSPLSGSSLLPQR